MGGRLRLAPGPAPALEPGDFASEETRHEPGKAHFPDLPLDELLHLRHGDVGEREAAILPAVRAVLPTPGAVRVRAASLFVPLHGHAARLTRGVDLVIAHRSSSVPHPCGPSRRRVRSPARPGPGQICRNATVIGARAARRAGRRPPRAPMTNENAIATAARSGVTRKANETSLNVFQLLVPVVTPFTAT